MGLGFFALLVPVVLIILVVLLMLLVNTLGWIALRDSEFWEIEYNIGPGLFILVVLILVVGIVGVFW